MVWLSLWLVIAVCGYRSGSLSAVVITMPHSLLASSNLCGLCNWCLMCVLCVWGQVSVPMNPSSYISDMINSIPVFGDKILREFGKAEDGALHASFVLLFRSPLSPSLSLSFTHSLSHTHTHTRTQTHRHTHNTWRKRDGRRNLSLSL